VELALPVAPVGRKRVARIMSDKGFVGQMGRSKVRTTIADKADTVARPGRLGLQPNRPRRDLGVVITYIPTGEGWLYLATVIDLFSRRVVGWALADHVRAELVCDALPWPSPPGVATSTA